MKEQYHPKYAKKQKVRLPISAYLSYLLIATLLLTGVSFSKYATTGSADDSARVALVMLDGRGTSETTLSLGDGTESAIYEFYITNESAGTISEVPLSYTISVVMPNGQELPDGIGVMLLYDGTHDPESFENGVYTFNTGASFAAGVKEQHDYRLVFTITDESQITEDTSFTGIEISVKAEQID